jgi:hypothetical protein
MVATTLPTISNGKIALGEGFGLGTDLTSAFTSSSKFPNQANK